MAIFLKNKRFNVNFFISDYQLRLWSLPIAERECRKTLLGGVRLLLHSPPLPTTSKKLRFFKKYVFIHERNYIIVGTRETFF